jgi:hypothetical protein
VTRTHLAASSGHFHAVRFYPDPESLARIVAGFIGEGLVTAQPAVIIATREHWQLIRQELHMRGFDVDRLIESLTLFTLDAHETLSQFMVDGMPDSVRFRAAIVPVIEVACEGRKNCVIRAYGEMVDVLWRQGQTTAATRLEILWNELAGTHNFSLLCGYSMGNFYKGAAVEEICSLHTHVLTDTGDTSTAH